MKKRLIFVFIMIVSLSLCSCNPFGRRVIIKNGFSNEMIIMLKDQYKLNIPNDAKFIEGYYWNAMQDGSINIMFEISEDKIDDLIIENWKDSTNTNWGESTGREYISSKVFTKLMYTGLFFCAPANGKIIVDFMGRYPSYHEK